MSQKKSRKFFWKQRGIKFSEEELLEIVDLAEAKY